MIPVVRGTASRRIVKLLKKEAGATEVRMCAYPCFYGIDIQHVGIDCQSTVEETRDIIGANP